MNTEKAQRHRLHVDATCQRLYVALLLVWLVLPGQAVLFRMPLSSDTGLVASSTCFYRATSP